MYQRIVVPLDGSVLAERALPEAEQLSRLTGAPLHLVRVIDIGILLRIASYGVAADFEAFPRTIAAERAVAREYLAGVERDLTKRGRVVSVELPQGTAADRIIAVVKPGDLLVMASHGRGGAARWFLGSVAEVILRSSPVPVLLVRANPEGPAATARSDEATGAE